MKKLMFLLLAIMLISCSKHEESISNEILIIKHGWNRTDSVHLVNYEPINNALETLSFIDLQDCYYPERVCFDCPVVFFKYRYKNTIDSCIILKGSTTPNELKNVFEIIYKTHVSTSEAPF